MTRLQFLWYAKRVLLVQIYKTFQVQRHFYDIFSYPFRLSFFLLAKHFLHQTLFPQPHLFNLCATMGYLVVNGR